MAESGLMEDLYREIILDHYRQPRNRGAAIEPTCSADGANPLCGDQIRIDVALVDGVVEAIAFSGQGCSISQASASLMSNYVAGKSVEEAIEAVGAFQQMMTSGEAPTTVDLGDIEALLGVAKFPVRVKCASLGWKTLEQALKNGASAPTPVTTDERSM